MGLNLTAHEVDLVFPFNVVIGPDMRILSVGRSMGKVSNKAKPGAMFYEVFDIYSPHGVSGWFGIMNQSDQSFTLKIKGRERLSLRGQFIPRPRGGTLVFVGSPSFNKTEEVRDAGLIIGDFAIHDPIMDFMFMHRGHLMALEDTKKFAKKLKETTGRLREILRSSPDGMASFSPTGSLLEFNQPFSDALGLPESSLIGMVEFNDFIEYLAMQSSNPEVVVKWFASPTETMETEIKRSKTFVELAMKTSDDGGRMVFMRNITLAKELDKAKSQFISTAAHELRTPMVSIVGFVELLLNRSLPPDRQKTILETIDRQGKVMTSLLTQLLDLARLESSNEEDISNFKATSPVRVVKEAVADLFLAGNKNIRVESDEILPDMLVDSLQARRAVANILSNSIKYSKEDAKIHVKIGSDDHGKPTISVQDNGIGMTHEQMTHLGERFWRADPSGTTSGTGLGIALVNEIMKRHNGSMKIDSVHGRGTNVTLTFQPA